MTNYSPNVQKWMDYYDTHDPSGLDDLLHDDCVFLSPVVHTPQRGKLMSKAYLSAASQVFVGDFTYVRVFDLGERAVLEFELTVDGIAINGADFIEWDENGKITEFKVMIRPLKGMQKIHDMMGKMLALMQDKAS